VMTEVSEVSNENALTGGVGGGTSDPPLDQDPSRETTLEIRPADRVAMAGLIRSRKSRPSTECPVSTSDDYGNFQETGIRKHETELMVCDGYVVRCGGEEGMVASG